jgi:hypothetical protein
MFYNTIALKGQEIKKARNNVDRQEDRIMDFFECFPHFAFAPFEINAAFPDMLLTSIRRTITDLTRIGKLQKTDVLVDGPYGMKTHTWKIKQ